MSDTRLVPSIEYECSAHTAGFQTVAGVDEAGRGALAGPVVAAAVIMPLDRLVEGVNDSKQIKPQVRVDLAAAIIGRCTAWGFGVVAPGEIDEINILRATHLAMRQALEKLELTVDYVLVDGLPVPGLGIESLSIVAGDAKCYSIAAASLIAKVHRDHIMEELDRQYPGYGFAEHKGYGTKEHREALEKLGPSPVHRLTFEPLKSRAQMKLEF